jgi:hypothetical protein
LWGGMESCGPIVNRPSFAKASQPNADRLICRLNPLEAKLSR